MTSDQPLVSVIITCYNIRNYVAAAIHSVIVQTYVHHEIIVVDDGSTDGTVEMLRHHPASNRFTLLNKENGGPSSARNFGIAQSKGEVIAFLDGDDQWEPDKLQTQVDVFMHHPAAGLIFTDFSTFTETGVMVTGKNRSMFAHLEAVPYPFLVSRNNFIYPSTVMIRRSVVELCGGFDESLRGPEDLDLWLRVARQYPILGLHESLTRIRLHLSNISSNIPVMLEHERTVIEKQRPFLSPLTYRIRLARLYFLNADRSVHNGDRLQALRLLGKGMAWYPFLFIPMAIVAAKFIAGGVLVCAARRKIDNCRWLRSCFELLYRRY